MPGVQAFGRKHPGPTAEERGREGDPCGQREGACVVFIGLAVGGGLLALVALAVVLRVR